MSVYEFDLAELAATNRRRIPVECGVVSVVRADGPALLRFGGPDRESVPAVVGLHHTDAQSVYVEYPELECDGVLVLSTGADAFTRPVAEPAVSGELVFAQLLSVRVVSLDEQLFQIRRGLPGPQGPIVVLPPLVFSADHVLPPRSRGGRYVVSLSAEPSTVDVQVALYNVEVWDDGGGLQDASFRLESFTPATIPAGESRSWVVDGWMAGYGAQIGVSPLSTVPSTTYELPCFVRRI